MKLLRGHSYYIVENDGDVMIASVTKNTIYLNQPAIYWKLYYRDYYRNSDINIGGRSEEFIANNWDETKYTIKEIWEGDIPYYTIKTILGSEKKRNLVIHEIEGKK